MTTFKEVAHLYLPFQCKVENESTIYTVTGISKIENLWHFEWYNFEQVFHRWMNAGVGKPILKKLTERNLTKEILDEIGVQPNLFYRAYSDLLKNNWSGLELNTIEFKILLKKGFDLFDLIENGEAIEL